MAKVQVTQGPDLLDADQSDLGSLVELLHRSIQDHARLRAHGGLALVEADLQQKMGKNGEVKGDFSIKTR